MKLIFFVALFYVVKSDQLEKYAQSSIKFTASLHKVIKNSSPNVVFSPFSASTILALTSLGANGDTQTQLIEALNLKKEDIKSTFKEIIPKLKSENPHSSLLSANKLFIQKNFKVEPDFLQTAKDFSSDVENVDFANKEVVKTINDWVEDQTNHKIQNLIKDDQISLDTKLVLVNALYFKGEWIKPFDPEDTKELDFHQTKEKTVKVQMMKKSEFANYGVNTDLAARFLELRYYGSKVIFTIVLPDEIDGLGKLEDNLELVLAKQKLNRTTIKLFLPKFRVETELNVKKALQDLGVKQIFSNAADLSGISKEAGLYVSDVVQKSFVQISEEGTEAAAATAVISNARSLSFGRDLQTEFRVDRPFLFFIKQDDIVLFSGRVSAI